MTLTGRNRLVNLYIHICVCVCVCVYVNHLKHICERLFVFKIFYFYVKHWLFFYLSTLSWCHNYIQITKSSHLFFSCVVIIIIIIIIMLLLLLCCCYYYLVATDRAVGRLSSFVEETFIVSYKIVCVIPHTVHARIFGDVTHPVKHSYYYKYQQL
jgi:hypothetical protein